MELQHPFGPLYNENSRVLIPGSFPSVKSREQNFFYGHPQNRFWKVVAAVFGRPVPSSIEEKKVLILESGLALWDSIASCEITGSSDASIRNVRANDIGVILDHCRIERIYCNGRKSHDLYQRYIMPLTVTSREYHSAREVTTVYQVDPEAFDHLAELVNEYDLYAASKRPKSKIEVLDGDTTRVSFSYSKGSFDIADYQVLNKKMSEGFREVQVYLASLANGKGVTTVEPQTAMLYLKSGYTLQFFVEEEFDGRMDEIFTEDREVSRYLESGIVLCEGKEIDVTGAAPVDKAAAGAIVYNAETGSVIILYKDCEFGQEVYQVAHIDGYISSAAPLIEEMEGPYRLHLN